MTADNIRRLRGGQRADRRRQRRCTITAPTGSVDVVLRRVSAAGAFVETRRSLPIDAAVTLRHPEVGAIAARVVSVSRNGAALRFTPGEAAVTFALAAMCADMTVPAIGNDG